MGMFYSYDNLKHSHQHYALPVKNESAEVIGFKAVVSRHPKNGGMAEQISDRLPCFQFTVFSTEKRARDFAMFYFLFVENENNMNLPAVADICRNAVAAGETFFQCTGDNATSDVPQYLQKYRPKVAVNV